MGVARKSGLGAIRMRMSVALCTFLCAECHTHDNSRGRRSAAGARCAERDGSTRKGKRGALAGGRGEGPAFRALAAARPAKGDKLPRAALIVSRSEPIVASTAEGSWPQCAMQLAQRGSLPRP